MSIYRIFLIEGIFTFVFTNLLFVNNVFIVNKKTIDPFILKAIFVVLLIISFLLMGIFSDISFALLILAIALGIRAQRGLKRKILNSKHKDPNLNYYWDLYLENFANPVLKIFFYSFLAIVWIYFINNLGVAS